MWTGRFLRRRRIGGFGGISRPNYQQVCFILEACRNDILMQIDLDLNAVVAEWRNRTASFKWPPGLGKLKAREGEVVALQGSVDVEFKEDVVGPLLHNEVGTEDVRWSDAVGTYLCGFIYFTDLVEMGKNGKNKKRDVSFMHVPYLRSEEELKVGVDVAKELVQSLVKTWRAQRGA